MFQSNAQGSGRSACPSRAKASQWPPRAARHPRPGLRREARCGFKRTNRPASSGERSSVCLGRFRRDFFVRASSVGGDRDHRSVRNQSSQLALTKQPGADTKPFAEKMVSDLRKTPTDSKAVATVGNVKAALAAAHDSEHQMTLDESTAKVRKEFDIITTKYSLQRTGRRSRVPDKIC